MDCDSRVETKIGQNSSRGKMFVEGRRHYYVSVPSTFIAFAPYDSLCFLKLKIAVEKSHFYSLQEAEAKNHGPDECACCPTFRRCFEECETRMEQSISYREELRGCYFH